MAERKVKAKVVFFAKARELSGFKESEIEVESSITYPQLLDHISKTFSLNDIKGHVVLAINLEYAENSQEPLNLKDGDEIAVIPPISGG
ncbi:molybdopterin synthase sulfur carrier subunit [Anabrus simplex]|uniref:molybdopterin synthase sulfur carrier subunit n=1 Tax=Anabrus simplex TaxID=316456 RepID=UPI0034DD24AB